MHILLRWGNLEETDGFEDVDLYDNIKMDLKNGLDGVYFISLGQNRDAM